MQLYVIWFEVGIMLWQKHKQSALFAFLFIQIGEESRCWKTVMVCLCIVMRRIHVLWYVTWPAQETVPDTEKGLRNANQNMATVANFGLSGLDNVLYFSYFYLYIYLFVLLLGLQAMWVMAECLDFSPWFWLVMCPPQTSILSAGLSPGYPFTPLLHSDYLLWLPKWTLWVTDTNLLERVCPRISYYQT